MKQREQQVQQRIEQRGQPEADNFKMKRFASVESKVVHQMGREQPRQPYQPEMQQPNPGGALTKA